MIIPSDLESRALTRRGVATRSRIVEAAAELIHEKGVDRTSLEDVMAASGVSKSQLYHYFADKDALTLEVIGLQTERVLGAQQPQLDAVDSLSALKAWRDALLRFDAGQYARGCPLGSLASELANHSEAARERLLAGFARWSDGLQRGLERMRDRGELEPAADPRALATALVAAIQGGLLLAKTERSLRPLRVALDMAIEHVERRAAPG